MEIPDPVIFVWLKHSTTMTMIYYQPRHANSLSTALGDMAGWQPGPPPWPGSSQKLPGGTSRDHYSSHMQDKTASNHTKNGDGDCFNSLDLRHSFLWSPWHLYAQLPAKIPHRMTTHTHVGNSHIRNAHLHQVPSLKTSRHIILTPVFLKHLHTNTHHNCILAAVLTFPSS